MKNLLLFVFVFYNVLAAFAQSRIEYQGVSIQSGDMFFVVNQRMGLSGAINRVTQQNEAAAFDHVGMLEVDGGTIYALHASAFRGSIREPLDSLLKKDYTDKTSFVIYRVHDTLQYSVPEAINRAKNMLGKPYNLSYVVNDSSYYCSDFVEQSYRHVNLFELEPMTFINPDTGLPDTYWVRFYERLGMEVPEGKLGCNPNGLAAHEGLHRVGTFTGKRNN